MHRTYLDNAATSFPKPATVLNAMRDFAERIGATPGRGGHAATLEADALVRRGRERLCRLFSAEAPECFSFTLNCTDSINMAIKGAVTASRDARPNAKPHIVTSGFEHNAVLRPLRALAARGEVEWTAVQADPASGRVAVSAVCHALRPDTLMVVLAHASNVTGVIQPAAEIGRVCRDKGILMVLDAAQTAGHLPVNVRELMVDVLAASGHKGLLGPQGTGVLYVRPGVESRIAPSREGGTGADSELDFHPARMPERYEAGTPNAMGIVGLSEGVAFLLDRGMDSIRRRELELTQMLLDRVRNAPGFLVVGGEDLDRVGTVPITHDRMDAATLGMILESRFGIVARAGLQCAPAAHDTLDTRKSGGVLRLSIGHFTSDDDIDRLGTALRELATTPSTSPPITSTVRSPVSR